MLLIFIFTVIYACENLSVQLYIFGFNPYAVIYACENPTGNAVRHSLLHELMAHNYTLQNLPADMLLAILSSTAGKIKEASFPTNNVLSPKYDLITSSRRSLVWIQSVNSNKLLIFISNDNEQIRVRFKQIASTSTRWYIKWE